jgi:Sulfocyanin (SoxE) domain
MEQAVRTYVAGLALITGIACSGNSQGSSAAPAPAAPTPAAPASAPRSDAPASSAAAPDTAWVKSDSAAKKVTLNLVVTKPGGAQSALINGYRAGQAQVVVPVGWTVNWDWRNEDPGAAHSLVVMVQREKVPVEGGRAAFSNAMSRSVTAGLAAGQTDQTTFEADEAGWYWLMCGVPSHALNGEWLELRVSPDARSASLQLKQK